MDYALLDYGAQLSLAGALSFGHGLVAPMMLDGAVVTPAFGAYLVHMLRPCSLKGDAVVSDNLSVHKASQVERITSARRAGVVATTLSARLPAHRI